MFSKMMSRVTWIMNNNTHSPRFNRTMSTVSHLDFNLRELCREGNLNEALHILLTTQNPSVESSTYLQLLQTCIAKNALSEGKKIHSHINERGFPYATDRFLRNKLINMYDKCGSLVDARNVFDSMTEPDVFSWNMIIAAYRRLGFPQEAWTLFHQMQRTDTLPDQFTILSILPLCADMASLEHGLQIHGKSIRCGFQANVIVANSLIGMYGKCGNMHKACELFDKMSQRDAVSWTAVIAGYSQNRLVEKALEFFKQMQLADVMPNSATFATILPACTKMGALEQGKEIHQNIIKSGFLSDFVVVTALIDMYAKCGNIHKAHDLFLKMHELNVVSWTAIIAGYVQNGLVEKAFEIFKQMQLEGIKSDSSTFTSILPACAKKRALEWGMEIHQKLIESRFLSDDIVVTALIDMYAKSGRIQKAHKLFDKMHSPNVISWTAMITGYAQNDGLDEALEIFKEMPLRNVVSWTAIIAGCAQNGLFENAFQIFKQMQFAGVKPNSTTFSSILPACSKMGELEQGMNIHQKIIESGFLSDGVVVTSLIDMYAKCGSVNKAHKLFDKLTGPNVVSCNAMIVGYAQSGLVEEALKICRQMQLAAISLDSSTFASILPACAKLGALEQGMEIHQKIIESRFLSDVVVVTALIDMYAKCGSIDKAQELFDKMPNQNVVSWNAMIVAYAQNGFFEKALHIFKQMQMTQEKSDSSTFASILSACAKHGVLEQGLEIHQKIIENGYFSDVLVVTALIDMYAKCGSIQRARNLFDKMHNPNVASWNAMIAGYTQNGVLDKALRLFKEMPQRDVVSWTAIIVGHAKNGPVEKALKFFKEMQLACEKPNSSTFASILPVCAKLGALEQGMVIHQKIIESGLLSDVVVLTALIDMYAKCGSIQKAHDMFDTIHYPDVVSWNAIIAGYAMHGYSKDSLKLFELMKDLGTRPDHVSFICVLFACSHAGLVEVGCKYFNHMNDSYCIMPSLNHYVCMVDLLGRAGFLEEALNFITKMPIKPDVVVWMCLFGACRSHKNLLLGEFVATVLFELDPRKAAPYVLLSNIYAEVGRWADAKIVRKLMNDRGIRKIPGCSWIEVETMVHAFYVREIKPINTRSMQVQRTCLGR